jgi:hypothetical protein
LEIITQFVKLHVIFQKDIRWTIFVIKETPPRFFKQFVDFDTGFGF